MGNISTPSLFTPSNLIKATLLIIGCGLFYAWLTLYTETAEAQPQSVKQFEFETRYGIKIGPIDVRSHSTHFHYHQFDYIVLNEENPRVLYAPNFLTSAECDEIVNTAKDTLDRSQVVDKDNKSKVDDVRTSSGTWLAKYNSGPATLKLVNQVTEWSKIPSSHGEMIQVLQYQNGQQYLPHNDFFDPVLFPSFLEGGKQRVASSLTFLSDVEEGGETIFPAVNLKVKPKKGAAILWYNLLPDGSLDAKSLHGGSPVIKGTKYVAVEWLRQETRDYE